MNQSVHIQDGYQYQQKTQQLIILALVSGMSINCYIKVPETFEVGAFYREYQFDIEEAIVEHFDENPEDAGEATVLIEFIPQ